MPFEYGAWQGLAYKPWREDLRPHLQDWFADPEPRGISLKKGVVWKNGSWAIKRFPARGRTLLRRPPAVRAAERFRTILPVPSPRPWLALTHHDGRGTLVSDFIQGISFLDIFDHGGPAIEAFPAFMALMHRHRVFHGDLNCQNMLWNGQQWVLLDLDGLRTGLHQLRPKHLIRRQWAQLYAFRDFSNAIRDLFWQYHHILHPHTSPEPDWAAIEQRAHTLPAHWHKQRNPRRRKTSNGHPKNTPPRPTETTGN